MSDSIMWQQDHKADSLRILSEFNVGDAIREASSLGRPLTEQEMERFRDEKMTTRIPRKRLEFDGVHYTTV